LFNRIAALMKGKTPPDEIRRLINALTGDTPSQQLRKLEWAIWSALGDIVVEDAGPRYESASFLAAHLYVAGAIVHD
jgi:hypothetical protein